MSIPTESAIDVVGVRKAFGSLQALAGVDFSIRRGEFFGLLGPNGAGKSTLISIIAGLAAADSGRVSVFGHDTVSDFRTARRRLGVVPQELVFDPFFKVRDMLRIQAGYYGCGEEVWPWIDEMLERLGLADKAEVSTRALSGGMKRRVLIAQAMVHKPDVVILDEPTAGVDVELRRTLWEFMTDLHRKGLTVVLTTHYLEEAQEMCNRIAILDRGNIRALEPTQRLLAMHPYRFLRLKLGAGSALPTALEELISNRGEDFVELKLDTGRHPIGGVFEALRSAGAVIEDVQTREPDLEDIFVELTSRKQEAQA